MIEVKHEDSIIAVQCGKLDFKIDVSIQPVNYDFLVWFLLLYHTYNGLDLEMNLPVTEECIFNVGILQNYIHKYLGFKSIKLIVPTAINRNIGKNSTVIPFSGGVDSCFTLMHSVFSLGRKIKAGVHILGHDLQNGGEFSKSKIQCASILNFAGAEMITVSTDARKKMGDFVDWRLQSDMFLSGSLHLFDSMFSQAFISGGGDGGDLTIKQCFGTPFLNERLFHLFSNSNMTIDSYCGEAWNRIQKIEYLSKFQVVCDNLRVCWARGSHGNCGLCMNCVTTQLAFLASKGMIPRCFGKKLTKETLNNFMGLASHASKSGDHDADPIILRKRMMQIRELAYKTGIQDPLLTNVIVRLEKNFL